MIELPKHEFEMLRQDEREIHLFDKVVNKTYIYVREEKKWVFPVGSRTDVILILTGLDLEGSR